MSPQSLLRLRTAIRSAWDRLEASSLPRLQTSEIVGAVTVACVICVLMVLRWLSA